MAERTIELDTPILSDETANALREATDRAERAEAELARLKAHATEVPAGTQAQSHAAPARGTGTAGNAPATESPAQEGNLFDGQEPLPDAVSAQPQQRNATHAPVTHSAPAKASAQHATHSPAATDDAVHADTLKQPPTPSSAANAATYDSDTAVTERGSADRATEENDGVDELRKDPMMAHLLDSLDAGTDVGHYGRLVFSMVARHFMPHPQVIAWLTKDGDFSAEQAQGMLHQVEGRDYNPPRRERLLQWQREQQFQFMNVHDPDSGNLYRNLEFPKEVYDHIGYYQEAKASE